MKLIYGLGLLLLGGCTAGVTYLAGGEATEATWKGPALIVSAVLSGLGVVLSAISVWQGRDGYKTTDAEKDKADLKRDIQGVGDTAVMAGVSTRAHLTDEGEKTRQKLDEVLALLNAGGAFDPNAIASAVARQGEVDLPEALLAALADRTDASLSLEDQVSDLISRFDAAQEIIREGSAPSNLDAFVKAVQKRVADKMLAGDLDGADTEAEDAFAQWERQEAERAEAAQRNGVALIETAIETALARGDAEAVARREMRKIALMVPEAGRFEAARDRFKEYYYRGERTGTRIDLQISAALARIYGQTDDRGDWAMAKNDLGAPLQVLGERDQDGALEQAVAAYRAALTLYTREAAPMQWAATQFNLALAYEALADHGDDPRGRLEAALEAVRGALEVFRAVQATYNVEKAERLEARVWGKLDGL